MSDRLELWASRAGSLRNVCVFLAFACAANFVVFLSDARANAIRLVFALGALGFSAAALTARRRPFATGVALMVVAVAAWALLAGFAYVFWLVLAADGRASVSNHWPMDVFLVLSVYWPLSYLAWTIELAGADRWIRRPGAAPTESGPAARRALVVLRAIATPLGWALLLALSAWTVFAVVGIAIDFSDFVSHSR